MRCENNNANTQVIKCGRASQWIIEPQTASIVKANARISFSEYLRIRRNTSAAERQSNTTFRNTTPASPVQWCTKPKRKSHPHSQAYQRRPGIVNEKKSTVGILPCCKIQSPVRICQPVSPSDSNWLAPRNMPNSRKSGKINAKSVSDGSRRTYQRLVSAGRESCHGCTSAVSM